MRLLPVFRNGIENPKGTVRGPSSSTQAKVKAQALRYYLCCAVHCLDFIVGTSKIIENSMTVSEYRVPEM